MTAINLGRAKRTHARSCCKIPILLLALRRSFCSCWGSVPRPLPRPPPRSPPPPDRQQPPLAVRHAHPPPRIFIRRKTRLSARGRNARVTFDCHGELPTVGGSRGLHTC